MLFSQEPFSIGLLGYFVLMKQNDWNKQLKGGGIINLIGLEQSDLLYDEEEAESKGMWVHCLTHQPTYLVWKAHVMVPLTFSKSMEIYTQPYSEIYMTIYL